MYPALRRNSKHRAIRSAGHAGIHLGEELLEKLGILEKTPEKKVETPRKKGESKTKVIMKYIYGECGVFS